MAPQWNMPLCLIPEGASALWRKFHGAGIAQSSIPCEKMVPLKNILTFSK